MLPGLQRPTYRPFKGQTQRITVPGARLRDTRQEHKPTNHSSREPAIWWEIQACERRDSHVISCKFKPRGNGECRSLISANHPNFLFNLREGFRLFYFVKLESVSAALYPWPLRRPWSSRRRCRRIPGRVPRVPQARIGNASPGSR